MHGGPAVDAMSATFSKIIAYEAGELGEDETLELFAELVRTGLAWRLQGHYGRTAASLIDAGLIDVAAVRP